jgi:hypothetical protein
MGAVYSEGRRPGSRLGPIRWTIASRSHTTISGRVSWPGPSGRCESLDAGHEGGIDDRGLERRDLQLKGKTGITSVLVLPGGAPATA